jgi:predicted PurR-regulated permease PerM
VLLVGIAALTLAQMLWVLILQFGDLILLFVFAWVISFLLEPVVASLSRIQWLPRPGAVLIVYAALLITLSAGTTLLIPVLVTQTEAAVQRFPELEQHLRSWFSGIDAALASHGLSMADYTAQITRPLESIGPALVSNAVSVATATASVLAQVTLVLVLSLYFMLDGQRLGAQFVRTFPSQHRQEVTFFIVSINRAFGGFLRGQIIQAVVYGAGIAVIMIIMQLPFAALASVIAGFSIFIPFIGPILGILAPVVIALVADFGHALIVLILATVLNLAVVNVLAPKVMSDAVGLSPVMVLAAVIIGARLGGPWGALFGIPVAAVIATMIAFYQLNVADRAQHVVRTIGDTAPIEDDSKAEAPSAPSGEFA